MYRELAGDLCLECLYDRALLDISVLTPTHLHVDSSIEGSRYA